MDREERLPTRVSKACDRCKSQKKRCDLARPCRHCVRAQIECKTQTLETKGQGEEADRDTYTHILPAIARPPETTIASCERVINRRS
ncbi:hypothetical protein DL95DRAFT_162390 [Leptodontidium sp. 2 PMI_412]|nr:hypothetical protein DL95DRAFT_162390 [Leptodontidium sp. 2 PMI_412]